jgi:uncharacterized protein (DUF1330 family)
MIFIHPEQGSVETFLQDYPRDTPVVMLNLLKFREQAEYPPEHQAEPCSGAEAYGRYGQAVEPLLKAHGAEQVWLGQPAAMLIGPQDKDWHLAILVRYPSAQAFVDMVTSPEYLAIVEHRTAGLEDSRLIAHREL